ncbi:MULTISPECIES: Dabb family protein [unclassified Paenibacillus]|uniref:Dabb family protein n=1 Tax=unclassified Paenibacillus TaxID=185978 RepID=UPI000FE1AC1B|nr:MULTISPECIES: Dabb family protein [unclassified Paenibacillus]MCM3172313.1 Dabb family protein [Paenibacillus sp. MER 99-2]
MSNEQIIHSVVFSLKHEKGSAEEAKFIQDGKSMLSSIPTVNHFQVFREISPKNNYDFGFSMVFHNREDYEAYNAHPTHVEFVSNRWEKEVTQFMEVDYGTLE